MADLAITAANVLGTTTGTAAGGTALAGAAITAGQPIYIDTVQQTAFPAVASGSASQAAAIAIALNNAATGQPVTYQMSGDIVLGATLVPGGIYCVSANSGKIAPYADLIHPNFVTILGIASTTTNLPLTIVTGPAL